MIKNVFIFSSLSLLIFCAVLISSCKKREDTFTYVSKPRKCIEPIRKKYPGQVLVLLFGREKCPGTKKATAVLDEYMKRKPEGVTVLRVDVPLPGQAFAPEGEWTHSFERTADPRRVIADQLSFFYYPTLYIFDKDAVLRFSGGCDLHEFPAVVKKIIAEKKGEKKRLFSKAMPAAGSSAPDFSAKTTDGLSVTLRSLSAEKGLCLFFTRASCSFSLKELDNMHSLIKPLESEGIATALIVQDEGKDALDPFLKYKESMIIIPDTGNTIFNKYDVSVTPYFYFIDGCGKIFSHRSFTKGAVLNTMTGYLQETQIKDSFNVQGAG